eukprot:TRINITY_DN26390_c0_g1_i1.p1 TRINITY_DN26390_c0_g1~~TRINITY_DN26390_c0_g1_i1.p1  ORF type:complete len:648 (-),score=124.37 TRINITY_DN26390_c0_g1_i1:156-2099(-)
MVAQRRQKAPAAASTAAAGQWTCSVCTLENPGSRRLCDACDAPRPRSAVAVVDAAPAYQPPPRTAATGQPAAARQQTGGLKTSEGLARSGLVKPASTGSCQNTGHGIASAALTGRRKPIPVPTPNATATWRDERWKIRRLHGEAHALGDSRHAEAASADLSSLDSGAADERTLRFVFHCSDPDWEAINWAPEGLLFEVRVPDLYAEPTQELPQLHVLAPEDLPERFADMLPKLFEEFVRTAAPWSPSVYRGLQHVDRNMTALFLKLRELQDRLEEQAAADAEAKKRGWAPSSSSSAKPESDGAEQLIRLSGKARVSFNEAVESQAAEPEWRSSAPAAPAKPAAPIAWAASEVRRLGVEVRTMGLTMDGFTAMTPTSMRLQIVCTRCRKPTDMATEGTGPQEARAPCQVCKQELELRIVPNISHAGCATVAYALGQNCQPVQFIKGDFEATCGQCADGVRIRNVGPGYRKRSECTKCYAKQNVIMEGASLIGQGISHWQQVAEGEGERMSTKNKVQEARRIEREMGVRHGEPLPGNGACKHYTKSYRWLRFPCCGRAFPCDKCHDDQCDHPHEWAKRMLCGYCSHEQLFSRDECVNCGASQTRARTAYWEGGEGCRNKVTMSKNDPHKYRGLGKCVSSKVSAKIHKNS